MLLYKDPVFNARESKCQIFEKVNLEKKRILKNIYFLKCKYNWINCIFEC